MTRGSPQSAGEATPGGAGKYLAIRAEERPTCPSGGQLENPMVPPGFNTRNISATATSGRGAKIWPNWLTTMSNAPSSKGKFSASASRQSMETSEMLAFWRARSNNSGVRSIPATCAPSFAAVIATTPVPQPTSSSLSPLRTLAWRTKRGACGMVSDSSGEKYAQPCFCDCLNWWNGSCGVGCAFMLENSSKSRRRCGSAQTRISEPHPNLNQPERRTQQAERKQNEG